MVTGELVGHVVRCGGTGPIDVWAGPAPDGARVAVVDADPQLPDEDDSCGQTETERGLLLTSASRWGSHRLAAGKQIWAEVHHR
jgi:hypothetical protein